MSCSDCGASLDATPAGDFCPACGGLRRDVIVRPAAALAAVAASSKAAVSIEYNTVPPWRQKWRDVVAGREEIKRIYDHEDMSNESVRREVENFFADCRELADWLEEAASVAGAKRFAITNPDLHICDGMAQTTKHHTRRRKAKGKTGPDPITARISRIDGGLGVRAEIRWSSVGGNGGNEDALDLAHRCVDAWLSFLTAQGLDPSV